MAAQMQSLRTNVLKTKIDKSQTDSACRMCKTKDETISHIVSECAKLTMKEYKRRHDCAAKALHWDLLSQNGFHHSDKSYQPVAPWEHSFWGGQRFKFSDDETIFPTKPTAVNPLLMSCFSRYHNSS